MDIAEIERENYSPWSVESLVQELEAFGAICLVAETSDSAIIGWCACRVCRPEAELLKIAVQQKSRGLGIGCLLLGHLFRELQKREITSLFLEVRSKNRTAMKFYDRTGFRHVGSRPGYYADPPDSALILRKDF